MPERFSRKHFVRGIGVAVASFAAAPTTAWNAVSAFATTGGHRTSALGTLLGNVRALARSKALAYTDPASGDPAILIRLNSGELVSYDAVCTHAGCTVGYDPTSHMLVCPCHRSVFDHAKGAAVVTGPAPSPLTALKIHVDVKGNAYALDGKAASRAKGSKLRPPKRPVAGRDDDGGSDDQHAGEGSNHSGKKKRSDDDGGGD